MKKSLYTLGIFIYLFTSCEKEIDLDYRSINPLYVVEGRINNEITEVLITPTRDMDDGVKPKGIKNAEVIITSNTGESETLVYDEEDGYYRSSTNLIGEVGKTYSLSVNINRNTFTSESRMFGQANLDEPYFEWLKVLGEKILFLSFKIEDIKDEENYYCYRVYRNGENYRWYVLYDRGNDGQFIGTSVFCMTEQMVKDNKKEDQEYILEEGDIMEIELQSIDKKTYDFLYSVRLNDNGSNPIEDFTGGCLGYFSAYSVTRKEIVFSYDNVKE